MWEQAQDPEAQALSVDVLRIATQAQTFLRALPNIWLQLHAHTIMNLADLKMGTQVKEPESRNITQCHYSTLYSPGRSEG